jgi:hypothetical protein
VAEVGGGDKSAEPEPRGSSSGGGQGRDSGEPGLVAERTPGQVIVSPRMLEPELLGPPPPLPSVGPPELRKDDDTEAHG